MVSDKYAHLCRICGLFQGEDFFPWGADGKNPSFDYCDCCGVEFGYQDCSPDSAREYRKKWMEDGAKWDEEDKKPANWSIEEQLKNIPSEYR